MSVSPLEALADKWSRFLGAICPEGRIPHPLPGFFSSPLSHPDIVSDISGRISSIIGLAPGGREDVVQGCLGNCPRSGSRLLQSYFRGGKGEWGLASCDRPLSLERICSANSVQDGDRSLRASVLASIDLEDTYFQIIVHQSSRKLLRFLSGGTVLSVQGPLLRTVDCPSGLHQGVCSYFCVGAPPRDSFSQVPGRQSMIHLVLGNFA